MWLEAASAGSGAASLLLTLVPRLASASATALALLWLDSKLHNVAVNSGLRLVGDEYVPLALQFASGFGEVQRCLQSQLDGHLGLGHDHLLQRVAEELDLNVLLDWFSKERKLIEGELKRATC
jgi:hypothetical protein